MSGLTAFKSDYIVVSKLTKERPVPNKKVPKSSAGKLRLSNNLKPVLLTASVALNAVLLNFIIVFCIAYKTGASYQTDAINTLHNNQCMHYDEHQNGSSQTVSAMINGHKASAYIVRVTQGQINSGCYNYLFITAAYAYYRFPNTQYLNNEIPVYIGPNGQNLEGIPQLGAFIKAAN
jgi:hypothetical protein